MTTIKNLPNGAYEMECQECGAIYHPALPCSITMFDQEHKRCKTTKSAPVQVEVTST